MVIDTFQRKKQKQFQNPMYVPIREISFYSTKFLLNFQIFKWNYFLCSAVEKFAVWHYTAVKFHPRDLICQFTQAKLLLTLGTVTIFSICWECRKIIASFGKILEVLLHIKRKYKKNQLCFSEYILKNQNPEHICFNCKNSWKY